MKVWFWKKDNKILLFTTESYSNSIHKESNPSFLVSKRLKNIDLPEFPSLKTIIVSLDLLYKKFTSAYGLTNTLEKRFLKINDEHVKVKYDDVMPCYEALDLFLFLV